MPTISMFYGILIRMFFHDTEKHHTPHIHADYQGKPEQIRPSPEFAATVDTKYIKGLGTLGERMLIVVNIERLMLSGEMALVDESVAA